ncbi:MAG: hypothetical protein ACX94D_08260 [Henriciella sp.]
MKPNIPRPESIRSGGFAGGASAGAARAPTSNDLEDLASALGTLSGTGRQIARTKFTADKEAALKAEKQQQEDAELQAELFKKELQGLSATEIQTAISTDPRLKEASPFVLPILQSFQGHQQAQEDFALFTEENPLADDPSAFRDWLRENGAQSDNAFAARGYNTEIARFESQFESTARGRLADKVVDDAKTVALANFDLALDQGATVEEALALTLDLWSNKESGFGLPRKGFNQIKMDLATIASNMGDLALFDEIVNATGSDGVPGLAANPSFMADVAKERRLATSRSVEIQKRGETEVVTLFQEALKNRDNPMSLRQLRADARFHELHPDTRQQLEGWAIAADNWRISQAEADAKDAFKANEELIANMRLVVNARNGIAGRQNLKQADQNHIFNVFRQELLDGNVTSPLPADLTKYITSISGRENRLVDPVFQDRFNGASRFKDLDPAALREREQDILNTVEQWGAVPREFRSSYAQGESRGLLDYLSSKLQAGVPILQAVQDAQFAGDFSDFNYGKVSNSVKKRIWLHEGDGHLGFLPDVEFSFFDVVPVSLRDRGRLSDRGSLYFDAWASDWLSSNGAAYLSEENLEVAMQADFEKSHVLYNNAVLPLPQNKNGVPISARRYRDALDTTLEALPMMSEDLKAEFGLPTIPTDATDIQLVAVPHYPNRLRIVYVDPEDGDFDSTYIDASMIERVARVNLEERRDDMDERRTEAAEEAAERGRQIDARERRERKILRDQSFRQAIKG